MLHSDPCYFFFQVLQIFLPESLTLDAHLFPEDIFLFGSFDLLWEVMQADVVLHMLCWFLGDGIQSWDHHLV